MAHLPHESLERALEAFALEGSLQGVEPLKRGHIHDTFVSTWDVQGRERRFLHQRMNEAVFGDLDRLMHNIQRVTQHMFTHSEGQSVNGFEPLRLIPTRTGSLFAKLSGGSWRTFVFIDQSESHDRCAGPEQAFEAARAFGWFQRQLLDLPPTDLEETLPDFFSSPVRLAQFQRALKTASPERLRSAADLIEFIEARAGLTGVIEAELKRGRIPQRIVHGDTKLNNILFCRVTGRAKGIVDLDTCMPGYSLYDFGDLVRFTAATSSEDERDMDRIGTDLELFEALSAGYLSMTRDFLTPLEIELMPFAARLVTLTIGMRFLSDYLSGDRYFKISRPGQNLDRAAVQLGMVAYMERNARAMGDRRRDLLGDL